MDQKYSLLLIKLGSFAWFHYVSYTHSIYQMKYLPAVDLKLKRMGTRSNIWIKNVMLLDSKSLHAAVTEVEMSHA